MSKNLSARYFQENKKNTIKKSRERYQNLSEEETEKKSNNMVLNVRKVSQKMEK